MRVTRFAGQTAGPALALLLLTGCGSGSGTVTAAGRVTLRGRPVTAGSVILVAADGGVHAGPIGADGGFSIPGVPTGGVKIGVTGPPAVKKKPAGRGKDDGRGVARPNRPAESAPAAGPPIPAAYADPLKSGLTGTVARGMPITVDLK